jgi:WD40 repeat protein
VCALVFGADALTLVIMAQQPSAHSNHVQSVSFSPDGKLVVSSSSDKSIKLWGEFCTLGISAHLLLAVKLWG